MSDIQRVGSEYKFEDDGYMYYVTIEENDSVSVIRKRSKDTSSLYHPLLLIERKSIVGLFRGLTAVLARDAVMRGFEEKEEDES